jgi:hypothetical protein
MHGIAQDPELWCPIHALLAFQLRAIVLLFSKLLCFKNKKNYKINEHNLNDRSEVSTTSSSQAYLCWDIKILDQYSLQGMTSSLPKNNTKGSSWENGWQKTPE